MNLDRRLQLRGSRDYLQSATLFDDILALRGSAVRDVDFVFHRKTGRQVAYRSEPPADGTLPVAVWRDAEATIHVLERDEVITESLTYDEPALVATFDFHPGGDVVIPPRIGGFTVMEAIVAAYKALLHRTVATHKPKVVFVRARLSRLPDLPVTVRHGRRIGEFYQGEILAGGARVGQIFFGEWK